MDPGNSADEEIDLYGLLGISKDADQDQIKKAYRKAALKHHPDKVPEEQRDESEAKFKAVTQAYEILRDEQKRAIYDSGGMAALRGGGPSGGPDLEDILGQMFGFGFGGPGGPGGPGQRRPRRGADEEQAYKISLEELYKGKTVKFSANKQVLCGQCKGSGAKEKVKPQQCEQCKGQGLVEGLRQVGPGLLTREVHPCDHCKGTGNFVKEKDRCKKCKGKRTVQETKALEIYIPRGSMQGERIVLEGEADQVPDQTPGDIVFTLVEEPHDVFTRVGADLSADLHVTLAEALGGFDRTVLTHLDGRGIHIKRERGHILRPGDVLKVPGEGMPHKRGDAKGDLYLIAAIDFPEDGWLQKDADYEALAKLLPGPKPAIEAEEVDEVDYEDDADIEEMGVRSGDPRAGGHSQWEDMDDEGAGQPQCQTQ
ncbi:related to DnaJ homolog subfamily A member 2 [Cephalotrichum gorgonifer]|uniref:Related to DnaJ homolog subfamily A member 2 n=1 Tax=Cephalotrichum gorgonifer TaxID=2041049 RepID=A0AAE8MY42_9PEZI|nr:related to DnaJ homolog subfamily A member 2 [Cephalotrichum gorgonifer]